MSLDIGVFNARTKTHVDAVDMTLTEQSTKDGIPAMGQALLVSGGASFMRDASVGPTTLGRGNVAPGTGPFTSLAAANATGPGSPVNYGSAANNVGVQISTTGAPTSISVTLQGSLDNGTTWNNIGSAMTAAGLFFFQNNPCITFRLNLGTLSGGTTPTVTGVLCAY